MVIASDVAVRLCRALQLGSPHLWRSLTAAGHVDSAFQQLLNKLETAAAQLQHALALLPYEAACHHHYLLLCRLLPPVVRSCVHSRSARSERAPVNTRSCSESPADPPQPPCSAQFHCISISSRVHFGRVVPSPMHQLEYVAASLHMRVWPAKAARWSALAPPLVSASTRAPSCSSSSTQSE